MTTQNRIGQIHERLRVLRLMQATHEARILANNRKITDSEKAYIRRLCERITRLDRKRADLLAERINNSLSIRDGFEQRPEEQKPMSQYTELDIDLLLLVAEDSERSQKEARERIRALTPTERRDLRAACQRLDQVIENTWFDELRDKRIERKGEQ